MIESEQCRSGKPRLQVPVSTECINNALIFLMNILTNNAPTMLTNHNTIKSQPATVSIHELSTESNSQNKELLFCLLAFADFSQNKKLISGKSKDSAFSKIYDILWGIVKCVSNSGKHLQMQNVWAM